MKIKKIITVILTTIIMSLIILFKTPTSVVSQGPYMKAESAFAITTATTVSSVVTTSLTTQTTTSELKTTTTTSVLAAASKKSSMTTTTTILTTSDRPRTTTKCYVVFKESTHYIHKSNCRWNDKSCIRIENTEGIEARKCTECNPKMEIINEFIEPAPVEEVKTEKVKTEEIEPSSTGLSDYEILLLRKIVSSEYGSDWVSVEEKAKVVAGVMNRVRDPRFPDTIYGVLTQPYQFSGFNPDGDYYMSDSIIAAVDYYFNNESSFGNFNSWYGANGVNHFYYQ